MYQKAHTPWDWVSKIFELANAINLPVFASPFDPTAVDFLEALNCPVYKIASPEITDIGLIEYCAKTGKPMILSTGLAYKEDIDLAVNMLQKRSNKFALLKCVSAYPAPTEEMNLSGILNLQKEYNCPVGLSDHTLDEQAASVATALEL